MKKILLFILLMILMGCTTTETTTENPYVAFLEANLNICSQADECSTDFEVFSDLYYDYSDIIINKKNEMIGESGDFSFLRSGEIYNRDDIPRSDPLTANYDFPILYPYSMFETHFNYMYSVVKACTFEGCGSPFDPYITSFTNIEYQFNQTEGMYSYLMKKGDEIYGYTEFKYIIDDETMRYERVVYDHSDLGFSYNRFDGTVFEEFKYTGDGLITYNKINVNTYEVKYYNSDEQSEYIYSYNNETKLLSKLYDGTSKSAMVSYYDNFEFVTSLEKEDSLYTNTFSFYFMNGWNQLEYRPEDLMPYSRLLNDDVEVFTDFDILTFNQSLRYYSINGTVSFLEEELDTYTIPKEYSGLDVFSDLVNNVDMLLELEDALNLFDMSKTELIAFLEEQKLSIAAIYIEKID